MNIFFLLLLFAFSSHAQLKELQLKAMFLEAAIRFITWPVPENDSTNTVPSAVPDTSHFTIGIFKGSPVAPNLRKVFKNRSVKDVPVRILELDNPQSVALCNLILISDYHKKLIPKIVDITRNKPILTVTDNPVYLENGIILCITINHRKIECHINKAEVDSSHFKISHHLLKKSIIFTPKNTR